VRGIAVAILLVGVLILAVFSFRLHLSVLARFTRAPMALRRDDDASFYALTVVGLLLIAIGVWFLRAAPAH
jgi:hypothetical protein